MKSLTQIGGEHGFKIQTVTLLHEIADAGLDRGMGVLKVPLNVLVRYLDSVATRASQLNDPILNKLMCDMALYEVADPSSKEYNQEVLDEVYQKAKQQRIEENK